MVEVIRKKTVYILNNISLLEKMLKLSFDEYEKDIILKKATERLLQELSEAIIDISNHIIAKQNLPRAASNKEIFDTLIKNGIISTKFKNTLYNLASFKNFIVHSYDKIDDKIVFNVAKNKLKDIKQIVNELKNYVP